MAKNQNTILVVDDDPKTVRLVQLYLERDGHLVHTAESGTAALERARELEPDLVVLDLMLPGLDGIEVCRRLREESNALVVMLTARTTEQDKLAGLDGGADDYVVKPFSPRELAARVRAVLRRVPLEMMLRGPRMLRHGGVSIELERRRVAVNETEVHLTPVEFRLLALLMKDPNRVFTRAQLVERAFGYDYDGLERTIDVHILNLRRKIEVDATRPQYIKTVYGVGYTFTAEQPYRSR